MSSYEQGANSIDELAKEFGADSGENLTEADTRVKLIDRILKECLGWPEAAIRREEHIHEGYIDYTLQSGATPFIIEAKRVGTAFLLPASLDFGMHLTVKNVLAKQRDLHLMYSQVVRYAHERGIQFCGLTNGRQWLLFPGVRIDNIHLRQSRVVAFNGLASIQRNFLDFWNLMSYDAVKRDSLQRVLGAPAAPIEPSFVFNAEGRQNIPYDRNHLALPLVDILPKYFGDLHGDPAKTKMLEACFVADAPVRDSLRELGSRVDEEIPSKSLTAGGGVVHFYSLPQVSEKLDALIDTFVKSRWDTYFQILLGRVGVGKTTFIAHFFGVHRAGLGAEHYVVTIDCQQVTENTDLAALFDDAMWASLIRHPRFSALTASSTLRKVFRDEVDVLERGPLVRLKVRDAEAFEDEIDKFLGRCLQDRSKFVEALSRFLHRENFGRFMLVFDNVDQLDPELQEKVIRFAYSKMKAHSAFVILSMWEETYFSSKKSGRSLSTIRTVPLQITRQSITSVLVRRLNYLLAQIESGQESLPLLDEGQCDRNTFTKFLRLILHSLLVHDRRVRSFLELVALGNIRRSLEMFSAFLTAGSLETRKILDAMWRSSSYRVPVHEFIKSVMLGSKRFYSERTSDVLNVFAVGDMERPSHFTRLRLLQWLYERRYESTPFGAGLLPAHLLTKYFSALGVSEKDLTSSVKQLVSGGLVENELRARKLMDEAQALRITAAGRYYLITLHRLFAYFDLVMQDTPFFDREVFDRIEMLCPSTDMAERVERCEVFLDYLADQEEEELLAMDKLQRGVTWRKRFVPMMRVWFEREKRALRERGYLV